MTGRQRVPLAALPNGTNSPYRTITNPGTKRPRSHASHEREIPYGQPPPEKKQKQIVEVDDAESRYHGLRKNGYAPPTALQRRLEAVSRETKLETIRESRPVLRQAEKQQQKAADENLDSIRQWQRHYKKVFPSYVFYFEHISEETRKKVVRQVESLGAREEKFFSKAVTHVITTRPIPADIDSSSSAGPTPTAGVAPSIEHNAQSRTINPSLLLETQGQQKNGKFTFEAPIPKRLGAQTQSGTSNDLLYKAKELGMKIWQLEKLNRMMQTMFHTQTGEEPSIKSRSAALAATKRGREADLSQLLQNEKQHGAQPQEMAHFRGCYVYVHDMDEHTRPVMIRDYPKVDKKEDGKWPQLRLTGPGRCPFVEDPGFAHRQKVEQQRAAQAKLAQQKEAVAPRTRAATAMESTGRRALAENTNVARRGSVPTLPPLNTQQGFSKPLDPPKLIPAKRANPTESAIEKPSPSDNPPHMFGSTQARLRAAPRFAGGEPVASGIQPSNITSAIRSQMISSTAAAPGARAGTSKEVHQLKRKVLERNSQPNSMPSSYLNDLRATINNDRAAHPRAAKRKAQDSLANIHEETVMSEEETKARKAPAPRKKKAEKELKPGYCENCRDKFNDFDEHVLSRKHRKFALAQDNWAELDNLLNQLERT